VEYPKALELGFFLRILHKALASEQGLQQSRRQEREKVQRKVEWRRERVRRGRDVERVICVRCSCESQQKRRETRADLGEPKQQL